MQLLGISFILLVNFHLRLLYLIVEAAPTTLEAIELQSDLELMPDKFQGDMLYRYIPSTFRNGLVSEAKHWPNKTVPYIFGEIFDKSNIGLVKKAMEKIEQVSCVRFVPATPDRTDYLKIQSDDLGCYSDVGYTGQVQIVNLDDGGCFKYGVIIHELLHSVGFYHQQSTSERDEFVTIIEKNIKHGFEQNFEKFSANIVTEFGVPYDYGSIMHYRDNAFGYENRKTIIPKKKGVVIGQRVEISPGDISKLRRMYKCDKQM